MKDFKHLHEKITLQLRTYVMQLRDGNNANDIIQSNRQNKDKISGVPFNSMQEVLDDLKARREASESDE